VRSGFGPCSFGKRPAPSPEASSAADQADGDRTNASAVREADAAGAGAMANHAPPGESQRPEWTKPKGGHRPGTGRLGKPRHDILSTSGNVS